MDSITYYVKEIQMNQMGEIQEMLIGELMFTKDFKNYTKDVKKITKKYNRREIAIDRIEKFSAKLYKLINKIEFDLLVFPGNSGVMLRPVAEMVYEYSKLDFPNYIELPVYRDKTDYSGKFDIPACNEVLIIDDEIATGSSAKICMETVLRSMTGVSFVNFTILAENMYFEWNKRVPGAFVYFYGYANSIHGMTNNISHILSDKDFKVLSKYIPINAEKKQVLAMLLAGKIKNKNNNGEWVFDEAIEGKVVARTDKYVQIKKGIIADIYGYVKSGIEKDKDK